jgi:hypothetical protein
MSFITFQCYACSQSLRVGADKAGRKAKCHKCGTILTIPVGSTEPAAPPPSSAATRAAPPPLPATPATPVVPAFVAPLEEDLDEPRPRRRRRDYDDDEEDRIPSRQPPSQRTLLGRARLGLLLVFIGTCVMAGAFALDLIGYLLISIDLIRTLTTRRPAGGTGEAFVVLWRIGLLVFMGAAITSITGYVFCMLGPNKRGTMGLAISTLAVAGLGLLLTLIFKISLFFTAFGPMGGPAGPGMGEFGTWFVLFLMQLLFSAEMILFPLYLRGLSRFLKDTDNARRSMNVVMLGCVYAGERLITFIMLYVAVHAFARAMRAGSSDPRALLWILLILLWLGVFAFIPFVIFYILAIWRTRALID